MRADKRFCTPEVGDRFVGGKEPRRTREEKSQTGREDLADREGRYFRPRGDPPPDCEGTPKTEKDTPQTERGPHRPRVGIPKTERKHFRQSEETCRLRKGIPWTKGGNSQREG